MALQHRGEVMGGLGPMLVLLQKGDRRTLQWRIAAASLLPGAWVVLLLPSWTLLHWQPGMLFDGGSSLREMITTVVDASLYQLNPHFANLIVFAVMNAIRPFLIPTLCGVAVVQLVLILAILRKKPDEHARNLAGAHWLRCCPSPYFLLCLRLTYFKEWQYQEDVQRGYDVVAWYNHNRAIDNVEVSWFYYEHSDFYRALSGRENFASFTNSGNLTHPAGQAALRSERRLRT